MLQDLKKFLFRQRTLLQLPSCSCHQFRVSGRRLIIVLQVTQHVGKYYCAINTKMVSRPSFVLFLCVLMLTALSRAKPQNSSIKPAATNPKQSLVVNNNCGLAKSESEMLTHIKATVDSIAAKSGKGIFLLKKLSEVLFLSYVVGVCDLIRSFR